MFSELIKNPVYCLYIKLPEFLNVDQDVVQIHNDKDIELLSKDFIAIALKTSWKHD